MASTAHHPPAPAPHVTSVTRPYWEAAARGKLLLPRCPGCAAVVWYPRSFCPVCHSTELEWSELSGRGTIYSFTVNRTGRADHPAYRGAPAYVLAYVQLAEGPRVLTNVIGCEPEGIHCGQPVRAVFDGTDDDGAALVRFTVDTGKGNP